VLAKETTAVAVRSWAWVCGRSLAGIPVFESRRGHGCMCLVRVVYCRVEASAPGWSLVQRSAVECGISECGHEASLMSRPWPTRNKDGKIPSLLVLIGGTLQSTV